MLIPAAVLGIIAGGLVMNKLRLGMLGIVRFLLLMNFIPTLAMASLFAMGCSSIQLVGVTDHYGLVYVATQSAFFLLQWMRPPERQNCPLFCTRIEFCLKMF